VVQSDSATDPYLPLALAVVRLGVRGQAGGRALPQPRAVTSFPCRPLYFMWALPNETERPAGKQIPRPVASLRVEECHCPGQKPAVLVFKPPARPYKSPIQNRFT
jgi:hypothetical protein